MHLEEEPIMKWLTVLTVLKRIALVIVPLLWLAGLYLLLGQIAMSDFALDFSFEARIRDALGVPAAKEPSLVTPMRWMLLGAAVCGIAAVIGQWISEYNRDHLSTRAKRVLLAVQAAGGMMTVLLLEIIDFCLRAEGSSGELAFLLCAPWLLGMVIYACRTLRKNRQKKSLG